MKLIVKMEFGSQVYGCSTPQSDTDYKQIIIPSAKDILLGTGKETVCATTKKSKTDKNTSEDVDTETFTLRKYLSLLSESQTVATDMLFVPKKHWVEYSSAWETIVENKDKFINKQLKAFISYSKSQANRYGVRGSRMSAVRGFLELINDYPDDERIFTVLTDKTIEYLQKTEYCNYTVTPSGYLIEVVNSKIPVSNKVKQMKSQYQKIFNEYGNRSREAEQNQGIDWKSLSHSLRICEQGLELLDTGNISFPRPNADFLLRIKKGQLTYKEVATLIEDGLDKLEAAILTSNLPSSPDRDFINTLVMKLYKEEVCKE